MTRPAYKSAEQDTSTDHLQLLNSHMPAPKLTTGRYANMCVCVCVHMGVCVCVHMTGVCVYDMN